MTRVVKFSKGTYLFLDKAKMHALAQLFKLERITDDFYPVILSEEEPPIPLPRVVKSLTIGFLKKDGKAYREYGYAIYEKGGEYGYVVWHQTKEDVKLTCPVCREKFTYPELVRHLRKSHPRSFWTLSLAELDVSEKERELILQAVKEAEGGEEQ